MRFERWAMPFHTDLAMLAVLGLIGTHHVLSIQNEDQWDPFLGRCLQKGLPGVGPERLRSLSTRARASSKGPITLRKEGMFPKDSSSLSLFYGRSHTFKELIPKGVKNSPVL